MKGKQDSNLIQGEIFKNREKKAGTFARESVFWMKIFEKILLLRGAESSFVRLFSITEQLKRTCPKKGQRTCDLRQKMSHIKTRSVQLKGGM